MEDNATQQLRETEGNLVQQWPQNHQMKFCHLLVDQGTKEKENNYTNFTILKCSISFNITFLKLIPLYFLQHGKYIFVTIKIWHSEVLGFCTLSIICNSKYNKTQ
jgi:aromatic ring-opening dioxygenase LigB subunit